MPWRVRTITATSSMPGSSWMAHSTSPSSMRKPCTLTWSSMRPETQSLPSASTWPRSPVRYVRTTRPSSSRSPNAAAVLSGRLR